MDDETADGYSTPSVHGRPNTSPPVVEPDETPGAAPDHAPPSRRGLLVAGGLLLAAAAGGGVALGLSREASKSGPLVARVPSELAAASDAEQALIAAVDTALTSARGRRRTALRLIRADHVTHRAAVEAAIAEAVYPAVSPSPSASSTPPTARRSSLRSGEKRAATAAAARALRMSGRNAVLLASIAASEAAHAELLS